MAIEHFSNDPFPDRPASFFVSLDAFLNRHMGEVLNADRSATSDELRNVLEVPRREVGVVDDHIALYVERGRDGRVAYQLDQDLVRF